MQIKIDAIIVVCLIVNGRFYQKNVIKPRCISVCRLFQSPAKISNVRQRGKFLPNKMSCERKLIKISNEEITLCWTFQMCLHIPQTHKIKVIFFHVRRNPKMSGDWTHES